MQPMLRRATIARIAVALVVIAAAALGLREVVNSSTYQLFGDYVARVDTPEKVVALTFDDGPSPHYTPMVLDVLDRYHVKGTFFMMGRNVERFPQVAREVLNRGHEVGNHSYSHPKLIWMSPRRVREEIERTDALLRGIGVSGDIHFRPPHASKFIVLPYVLTRMHKLSVLGDVDPEEWKRRPAAVMTASILRQVRPGSIIGLHDPGGMETVRTLEDVLAALVRQGYRFETVSQLIRRRRTAARSATLVERARVSMGSELRLTAWTDDEPLASAAFDAVFAEFDRLESLMSPWREGSDVKRLNDAAGDHRVSVSPEVREVIQAARQISEWTGGKFDITIGALSDLWRFDHDQDNRIPDREQVRRRLPLIDYRALEVNDEDGSAYLPRRGMRVTLGGIGKGYAIDRAISIVRGRGLRDFMIQAGGVLYVAGTKAGRPWRLGIQDPRAQLERDVFATVDLSDSTFSTSGDYERSFVRGGRRYHHIIDPSTGEPSQGCRSVTIATTSAALADGLSTGVFLLGPADGLALVRRIPNVEAVIVTSKNEVLVTPRLKERLTLVRAPTDAP